MIHDTLYYGGDILNIINKTLGCRPSMDRGGKYIWVIGHKIIYCDMRENNNRGCLEVYESGQFKAQLGWLGILTNKVDEVDYFFDEDRQQQIITFLLSHCRTTRNGVVNLDISVKKEGE